MRLVLVHGINQRGQSEASLRTAWLEHIAIGTGQSAIPEADVSMPFYGDRLAELAVPGAQTSVPQGTAASTDMEKVAFLAAALTEQAQAAGVGNREIAIEQRAVETEMGSAAIEQGLPMDRRINAIVRVLERLSPLHGDLVLRLLQEAYAYLKTAAAASAVDAIVRPVIDRGPAVVVSHSLGTVVSFKLLRQLALEGCSIAVPLFVTLGSPLSLMTVQAALGPAFSAPAGVERWVNAIDPDDFIGLGRGLDASSFAAGIDNIVDIKNIAGNAHAIEGYLRDPRVARLIMDAFKA